MEIKVSAPGVPIIAMTIKRLRALGFDPIYDIPPSQDPLPWTRHWLSSKELQVAPQETEVESYLIGGINQDIKEGQFAKFKL